MAFSQPATAPSTSIVGGTVAVSGNVPVIGVAGAQNVGTGRPAVLVDHQFVPINTAQPETYNTDPSWRGLTVVGAGGTLTGSVSVKIVGVQSGITYTSPATQQIPNSGPSPQVGSIHVPIFAAIDSQITVTYIVGSTLGSGSNFWLMADLDPETVSVQPTNGQSAFITNDLGMTTESDGVAAITNTSGGTSFGPGSGAWREAVLTNTGTCVVWLVFGSNSTPAVGTGRKLNPGDVWIEDTATQGMQAIAVSSGGQLTWATVGPT